MGRQHAADVGLAQGLDSWIDPLLEQPTREVQAADETRDAGFPRQTLSMAHDVDRARVRTARENDDATVTHLNDERLIVPDHRIGLPTIRESRLVDRKARLE